MLKAIRSREGFRPSSTSHVKLAAKGGTSCRFGNCPPWLSLTLDFGRFYLHKKKKFTISSISAYLKFNTPFVNIYGVTLWLCYENVL